MPTEHRRDVVRRAVAYASAVVDREWDAMDEGRHDPQARREALGLIGAVTGFEPATEAEKALYAQQVGCAVDLWNSRRSRTNMAGHGMPGLKWAVLVVGGVITVFFTYFFAHGRVRVQALMTALVTVTIALNVYLVLMFGYPFSGDLRVDASSFRVIRELAPNESGLSHRMPESR